MSFRSLKTQTSFCDSVTAEVLQEHPQNDDHWVRASSSFFPQLFFLSTSFFYFLFPMTPLVTSSSSCKRKDGIKTKLELSFPSVHLFFFNTQRPKFESQSGLGWKGYQGSSSSNSSALIALSPFFSVVLICLIILRLFLGPSTTAGLDYL